MRMNGKKLNSVTDGGDKMHLMSVANVSYYP